jgi:hypothetical protein
MLVPRGDVAALVRQLSALPLDDLTVEPTSLETRSWSTTGEVAGIITLLRHAWARHRIPLIPIALAVGLFEFLLTRLAPLPTK